jgi:hypothetical protein
MAGQDRWQLIDRRTQDDQVAVREFGLTVYRTPKGDKVPAGDAGVLFTFIRPWAGAVPLRMPSPILKAL